eukprot:6178790-Pleurochrysis_carterae.AAC.1
MLGVQHDLDKQLHLHPQLSQMERHFCDLKDCPRLSPLPPLVVLGPVLIADLSRSDRLWSFLAPCSSPI